MNNHSTGLEEPKVRYGMRLPIITGTQSSLKHLSIRSRISSLSGYSHSRMFLHSRPSQFPDEVETRKSKRSSPASSREPRCVCPIRSLREHCLKAIRESDLQCLGCDPQTSTERGVSDAGRMSHLARDRCEGLPGEWRPTRECPADGCA